MNGLTSTSIARTQVMAARLQPEPVASSPELSAKDAADLKAIHAIRRPLLGDPIGAQSQRPSAPLKLMVQDNRIALGTFHQGSARSSHSIAALTYAAYQVDPDQGTRSPVIDLLV